jgi:hypothetical protein
MDKDSWTFTKHNNLTKKDNWTFTIAAFQLDKETW